MATNQRINPRVLDEAVEWQSCMLSGEVSEADIAACQAWRNANPSHELIWQRLQQIDAQFSGQPDNARNIIQSARRGHSRRHVLRSMLLGALSTPLLYAGYDWAGQKRLFADVTTKLGEYKRLTLPDGSVLHINTNSSVDIIYSTQERRIVLHQGEILIDSAPDQQSPKRDLIVQTPLANVKALGTRFIVKHTDSARVSVFSGAVAVTHKDSAKERILNAGFSARLEAAGIGPTEKANANQQSWINQRLVFDGVTLGNVVDEMNRYFPGYIFCTDQAAGIRVSGVYPLNDKQAILDAMQKSLPVGIEQRTRYWTLIHRPE